MKSYAIILFWLPCLFQIWTSVLMDSIIVTRMPTVRILMGHINALVNRALTGMGRIAKVCVLLNNFLAFQYIWALHYFMHQAQNVWNYLYDKSTWHLIPQRGQSFLWSAEIWLKKTGFSLFSNYVSVVRKERMRVIQGFH